MDFNYSTVFKYKNDFVNVSTSNGESLLEDMIISYEPQAGRSATKLESYIKYICKRALKKDYKNVPIHFKNGSLYKGVWYNQKLDQPSPFKIDFNYNKDAYCELTDDLLNRISQDQRIKKNGTIGFVRNDEKKQTLIDIVAHTFLTHFVGNNQKIFFKG